MFTANNKTIKVCNNYGILTSNRIERNPYGLPYIGSMYTEAYSMVNSSYYGYINADILVSDRIFDVLTFIEFEAYFYLQRIICCRFVVLLSS